MVVTTEGGEPAKKKQRVEGDSSGTPVQAKKPPAAPSRPYVRMHKATQSELVGLCKKLKNDVRRLTSNVKRLQEKNAQLVKAAEKAKSETAVETTSKVKRAKHGLRFDTTEFLRICYFLWKYNEKCYDVWFRSGIIDLPSQRTLKRAACDGQFQSQDKAHSEQPTGGVSESATVGVSALLPGAAATVLLPGALALPLPTVIASAAASLPMESSNR